MNHFFFLINTTTKNLNLFIYKLFHFDNREYFENEVFSLMHFDKMDYNTILDMPTDLRKKYFLFVEDIINKQNNANKK